MSDISEIRLDRTSVRVISSVEQAVAVEAEYWRQTTIKERLQHIERLRRLNYGDRATQRLQRVVRIVNFDDSE